MKTLTVYFSYTAGNTKMIAERIQKAVGGDIVELQPAAPYSKDYDAVVSEAQDEVENGYMPELKPLGVNIKDYDRIIIGTPTWWYKMASPVLTFLSENVFTGKIVVPYMTNAGWSGTVIKDMTRLAESKGAKVEHSHEFKFSSNPKSFSKMVTSEKDLDEWIAELR